MTKPSALRLPAAALLLAALLAAGCAAPRASGPPRVAVQVTDKGFEPKVVTVPAGQPFTVVVTRRSDQTCATDFVQKDLGIARKLPLDQAVEIAFPAQPAGELRYGCAMDMYHGTIAVK